MDCNVNDRTGYAGGDPNDIRADLAIPGPGVLDILLVKSDSGPAGQRNNDQRDKIIKQPCLHGKNTIPMTEVNRTTRARKKSGRCQI
jgi:hypothetical protein